MLLAKLSQPEDPTTIPAGFLTDHLSESASLILEVQLQKMKSPAHTVLVEQAI